MLKIIYQEKPYDYGEDIGCQNYFLNTEIELTEDATIKDILEAIIKVVQLSGYIIDKKKILATVEDILEDII